MKLVETRWYVRFITISDYVLLGLLWVISSIPLITLIPASIAVMYVMKKWHHRSTGHIFYYFFKGIRIHFFTSAVLSGLTVSIFYITNLLLQENEPVLQISGYVISIVYLMFIVSWCNKCSDSSKYSLFSLFEESALNLLTDFIRNMSCVFMIILFTLLIFLFPPFIFIFSGAVWKVIDVILNRKRRFAL